MTGESRGKSTGVAANKGGRGSGARRQGRGTAGLPNTDPNYGFVSAHTDITNGLKADAAATLINAGIYTADPYDCAPLTGYYAFLSVLGTNTDVISVKVEAVGTTDATETIQYDVPAPHGETILCPILGLFPKESGYTSRVTIASQDGSEVYNTQDIDVASDFPNTDSENDAAGAGHPEGYSTLGWPAINQTTQASDSLSPGLLFTSSYLKYNIAVDKYGVVRWYTKKETIPAWNFLRREKNGNFLVTDEAFAEVGGSPQSKRIVEFNMMGRVLNDWVMNNQHHHAFYEMMDGTGHIISCSGYEPGERPGPGSKTSEEDVISRINFEGFTEPGFPVEEELWDLWYIADNERDPVPTFFGDENDWMHLNQAYVTTDGSNMIVFSGRHQGVFGIDYATGELKFILATHEGWAPEFSPFLLTPVDEFDQPIYGPDDVERANQEFWPWGQHNCEEVVPQPTEDGVIEFTVFDDGNYRTRQTGVDPETSNGQIGIPPRKNFSRLVHYRVDMNAMTAKIVWEYGNDDNGMGGEANGGRGYSTFVSSGKRLSNGNYLINFGAWAHDRSGNTLSIIDNDSDYTPDSNPYDDGSSKMTQTIHEVDSSKNLLREITFEDDTFKTEGSAEGTSVPDPGYRLNGWSSFRAYKMDLMPANFQA